MSPANGCDNLARPRGVAVYCASSMGHQKAFKNAAISVGAALARSERPLVYGGGSSGIMGVVSGSALEHGGEVTGVIPYAMHAVGGEKEKTTAEINNGINNRVDTNGKERFTNIIVNSMHERKVEMAKRAGGFIGLPGGFGTYEEVFEVTTWTQIGIHKKPVVLLNVLSFYSPLRDLIRNGIKEGFIQPSNERLIFFVDGPSDLSEHESFDWGPAALEALDSWTNGESPAYLYDWSKCLGSQGEINGHSLDNS